MASAGVPDDAPDGEQRAAVLRAAERRSDRSQLRPADLADGGAARRRDGARAAARSAHRRRVERDVRLLLAGLRRLGAARPQHGLPADRGGQRQNRLADHVPAERAARRSEGPAGLRAADQLPRPVAGRPLDASRHRRLRPERGARAAVRGRRVPRADRPELLRHGPARGRGRPARRAVRVHHPARAARPARRREARGAAAAGRRSRSIARSSRSVPTASPIRRAPTSSSWRSRTAPT